MQLAMLDDDGTPIPDQVWSLPQPLLDSLSLYLSETVDENGDPLYPSEFAAIIADLSARFAPRVLAAYPPREVLAAEQVRLNCASVLPDALKPKMKRPSPVVIAPLEEASA